MAPLRLARPMTMVDVAGERWPVELEVEAVPQTACFSPLRHTEDTYPEPTPYDELTVRAELTLAGPALAAPLQLRVKITSEFRASSDSIDYAYLAVERCHIDQRLSPADFVARCGDWGIDLSPYTEVSLSISESRFGLGGSFAVFQIRGDYEVISEARIYAE